MKVTVLQENLARGLSTVSRAVSPRSTLPVLANILVATDDDGTTDSASATLAVGTAEPGTARKLSMYLPRAGPSLW